MYIPTYTGFTRSLRGAAWAMLLSGGVACFLAKKYPHLNSLAYLPFVMFITVIVGYVASLVVPAREVDLTGLTAYTLLEKDEAE